MEKVIKTEIIDKFLKENNLSKTKFCNICKISHQSLENALRGSNNLSLLTLFKITRTMGVHLKDIVM